jgi:hypothetical protein
MEQNGSNGWRAWIDLQPPRQTPGGRLHVHGSFSAGDEKINYQLLKAEPQGTVREELILEITPAPTSGANTIEVTFHEDLLNEDAYTSVRIRIKNRSDEVIDKIEKVH